MGKTNKKINSEKVNALRKQYDAYIENEKKRKERNDYILEKLDKIRSCNILVPLRHDTINRLHNLSTPQALLEYNTVYPPLNEQQHLTNPFSNVNENLMKEISKNFILIPKNKTKLLHELIEAPNENDNKTDWKSKYDILNQLKQSEKESVENGDSSSFKADSKDFGLVTNESRKREIRFSNKITNNNFEKPEKDLNNEWLVNTSLQSSEPHLICKSDIIEHKNNYTNNNNLNNDYEKEYLLPKKISKVTIENTADCSSEEQISGEGDNVKHFNDLDNVPQYLNRKSLNEDNTYDTSQYEPQAEIINSNIEAEEHTEVEPPHVEYNSQNENIHVEHNTNTTVPSTENLDLPSDNVTSGVNYNQENLKSQSLLIKSNDLGKVDNTYKMVSPVELISSEARADTELEKNATLNFEITGEGTEDSEYPIETINVKDFTPGDGVELHDDVNINSIESMMSVTKHDVDKINNKYDPQIQSISEKHQIEQIIHSSDIQAFEAEQNEMFYSEQANETYENTDINNTAQNENYENYQYYEGAHQDEVYGHDVNEYVETSQTYDPNYEQQYVDPYEQSQDYVEPVQQYETEEHVQYTNDANSEIIQQNIEPEPVIEKILDDEQGIHIEHNISEQLIGSEPSQT